MEYIKAIIMIVAYIVSVLCILAVNRKSNNVCCFGNMEPSK